MFSDSPDASVGVDELTCGVVIACGCVRVFVSVRECSSGDRFGVTCALRQKIANNRDHSFEMMHEEVPPPLLPQKLLIAF